MNENLVKSIVLDTGCTENIAEWMLEVTGGDIDKAKNIILSIPKNVVVLFLKFSISVENIFGIILWGYNKELDKQEFLDIIVSDNKSLLDLEYNSKILEIKKQLQSLYPSDAQFIRLTGELREFFNSTDQYDEYVDIIKEEDISNDKLTSYFNSRLFKFFANESVSLNFKIFKTDAFQLNVNSKPSDNKQKEKEEDTKVETKIDYKSESVVILKSQPIISPINGKPIPKFKIGDKMFAEITDKRDIGLSLKKLLDFQRLKEGVHDYIYGTIEEIEYSTNTENVTIMLQYGPGIYGRMIVNRDLKVEIPVEKKEDEENNRDSSLFVWLVILFVVIFILLLILKK